jgi:hypothetical protein
LWWLYRRRAGFPNIDWGRLAAAWQAELDGLSAQLRPWPGNQAEHPRGTSGGSPGVTFVPALIIPALLRQETSRSDLLDRWWEQHHRQLGNRWRAYKLYYLMTGYGGRLLNGDVVIELVVDSPVPGDRLGLLLDGRTGQPMNVPPVCVSCRLPAIDIGEHQLADGCLGHLVGAAAACCGHGGQRAVPGLRIWPAPTVDIPYVSWGQGPALKGRAALRYFDIVGKGPHWAREQPAEPATAPADL